MAGRAPALAATVLLTVVLAACGGDAERSSESPSPTSASSTPRSPKVPETPEPSYLPAGDLPRALSLEAAAGRTVTAQPFADFAVTAGDGVWVSGVAPGAVRYDDAGRISARARVPGAVVQALAASADEVLVPSLDPNLLLRIDAVTGAVRDRVRLPGSPLAEGAVGVEGDRAYVLVDPLEPTIVVVQGGRIVDRVPGPEGAVAVRAGYGSLWVPTSGHTVERYTLRSGDWTSIPVGPSPRFLDVGFDAVWVMNQGDGSVSRIDARTGATEQIAITGRVIGGGDLTVGGGAVWLRTDEAVARIDPGTRSVTHLVDLPPGSASAAATGRLLVITNHDHDAVHLVPLPLPD
jgi:virginiamycin B lyase